MEVLINQVGFDVGAPKSVVVRAGEDLDGARGRLGIVDARGTLCYEADLDHVGGGALWDGHYWRSDFSGFDRDGEYELRIAIAEREARYAPVAVTPRRTARESLALAAAFYYYQRCGTEVPGWHRPCHMDDARLPDGSHIDAVGGWHDAGDYNKYNGYTPLSVVALAKAGRHELLRPWPLKQAPPPLDEAAWGGAWLAKMQDEKTGLLRGDVFSGYGWWGAPEDETDNRPGTDDDRPIRGEPSLGHHPGVALLAFATLQNLRPGESRWLECARRLDDAAAGADLPVIQQAAAALAHLEWPEQRDARVEQARRLVRAVLSRQRPDGSLHDPHIVDQGFVPAALAEFALRLPQDQLAPDIQVALTKYLEFSAGLSDNPFRIMQWDAHNVFYPYVEPKAWYVGQNSMYLSQAWALLLAAKLLNRSPDAAVRDQARLAEELAWAQINWVLGCNPFAVCMLEGAGRFNPPQYHHRYNAIRERERGAVPGAVCNGYVRESVERDAPRFDLQGNDYHSTEPWLPHNAYYLLALSET
ncbi:MAG: glycoside hydrolase family 9 protein [Armatimonadota bacterium]|nr:MAG: glycoside hydrolase family 9 protein [Armatimonadota bacterium]